MKKIGVKAHAAETPEKIAFIESDGTTLTYHKLNSRINKLANAIKSLGLSTTGEPIILEETITPPLDVPPLTEKRMRELAEILEVPTSSISDLEDRLGSSRELSQVTGAFLSIMKTDYKARLERHNDFIQLLQEQYE